MKIRVGIFGLFFFVVVIWTYGEEKVYTVQKGETFFSIARATGLSAETLMRFNGISDPTRLQAGQRLRIPDSTGNSAALIPTVYKVVKGDTFYGIARKFSVPLASILEANDLSQNYVLKEGDTLKLPIEAKAPPVQTETKGADGGLSSLRWPVTAKEMSNMTGKLNGVVITGTRAEPVSSLTWGIVLSAGPYRGFGRVVIVQVDGGYLYVYGGCESLSVKEGDRVGPGNELGRLGVDDVTNKPQLFFMVYRNNNPIDPAIAPRA